MVAYQWRMCRHTKISHSIVQSYGIRVEPSLISNPEEEQRLKNEKYLQEEAQAIYEGILAYYQELAK